VIFGGLLENSDSERARLLMTKFYVFFAYVFLCICLCSVFSEQDARKENNGLKTASENQKTSCCHKSVGQTESLFLD
jgi:preprotein translocase subunit SecG